MKNNIFEKGETPWNNEKILGNLSNFIDLYEDRPIKNNKGGMLFAQLFYFYNILINIKPELVIESGVFKGQSTWLIEKTLPECEIISIDTDLNQREYISKKALYTSKDFKFNDFSNIPTNSLVLFDDHVNHLERIMEANFFGIKDLVFEDNYPKFKGDFQSIKQFYENYNFNHHPGLLSLIKTNLLFNSIFLKKIFIKEYNAKKDLDKITKRIRDGYSEYDWFKNISKMIKCYYEFPPLIKSTNEKYIGKIKDPIFDILPSSVNKYSSQINEHNFLTYIKLI